jgi:hypothetical protein
METKRVCNGGSEKMKFEIPKGWALVSQERTND